jgi:xanthine dehydrogenase accessory factor
MKELQEILKKISNFAPDERAILATVVDVQGSGYRRAGARMLVDENGYSIGTVSGGCLEADVLERAKKVLATGESCVITYDTTKDKNSVFGLGMGCRGIVRVLLEAIDKENHFFDFISVCFKSRIKGKIATLINSDKPNLKIGSRIFQDNGNFFANSFSFEEITEIKNLPETPSAVANLSFGEVFVETIKPPLNLLLFGAGYDTIPVVRFAKELGWRVTIFDHRKAFANAERFPEADEIYFGYMEGFENEFFHDENSAAIVMTHNYERDREILPRLLRSKFLYIGALGPKKRTEKILEESGETFSNEQLSKLHAPVGLDIGANSPEAIALAIVAEIQAVLSKRNGGFLRERNGSIYER